MKKWLIAIMLTLGLFVPAISSAELSKVSAEQWDSYSTNFWFTRDCDETVKNEMYVGSRWLYIDTFKNKDHNGYLYILEAKVFTTWSHLKYNNSKHCFSDGSCDNGLTILNTNLVDNNGDIKVSKWNTVLHMTTAEKISGAQFVYDKSTWKFTTPFTSSLWEVFNYANYASDWTHPATATKFPNWDTEFRTITLYSHDDKISTPNDNYAIVECQRTVIRRCGDGILDSKYEECDPKAPGWNETTCDPITCKKLPVCNSRYNWQPLTNLDAWPHLCSVWTYSEFVYNESTHTWTWKCDNVAWTVECFAKKPYDGKIIVEKTLLDTEYVTKTWEELKWQITVTASWWDVNNVVITDQLPTTSDWRWILSYIRTTPNLPNGVTMNAYQPTISNNGLHLEWKTTWTLKAGQSIILIVTTKVEIMPDRDWYKNIACARADWLDEECKTVPIFVPWKLEVKKEVISPDNGVVSHLSEQVIWKITVRAKWWDVKIEEITDKLPTELEYKNYTKEHIPNGITISEPTLSENWKRVTWKTSWTLTSWDYIELHLITSVIKMPENTVENIACAKPKPWNEECGSGITKTASPRIEKYILDGDREVKSITLHEWDLITYRIHFGNTGNANIFVSIKDFLPKGVDFISGTLSTTSSSNTWVWWWMVSYNWEDIQIDGVNIALYSWILLRPNQSGILTIVGRISTSQKDQTNRTNFACIYKEDGDRIACDDAVYYIWRMCKELNILPVWDLPNGGWSKDVTCKTTSWQIAKTIEIDCWTGALWNRYITWSNKSELTGTCTYPWWSYTYYLQCKVDRETPTNGCTWSVTVQGWWGPSWGWSTPQCESLRRNNNKLICKSSEDAYLTLWCDGKKGDYTSEKDTRLVWNYNEYRNCKKVYCYVNSDKPGLMSWDPCELEDEESTEEPMQWCFNVNEWNFSIEEWEIMPFYWNMANLNSTYYNYNDKDNYTTINWNYGQAEKNYENKAGESCEGKEGKIAADSMVCTFYIADWGKYHYGKKPDWSIAYDYLYKIKWPCLSNTSSISKKNLILARYNKMVETYCDGSRTCYFYYGEERPNVSDSKSAVLPTAVYYIEQFGKDAKIYANVWKDTWELMWSFKNEGDKAFWEYKIWLTGVDYLQCIGGVWTQQSSDRACQNNFVLTNSYTVQKTPSWNLRASTNELNKYLSYDGNKVFVEYLNAIETTEYKPNLNVQNAMDTFISKYSKLAVDVTLKESSFLEWVNIKKVPWKNIYFASGDLTIKWWTNSIKNPFTIVQTSGKTTISGNINHNMMLLTNWNIIFKWGSCETDQTVKWIFYAKGTLNRFEKKRNDQIDNSVWCTNGWLHVKWVLIWNKFDTLMDNSRSHINDWFTGQKNNRKKYVMNWASVVIEYSPSIFSKSTMPPGAEDFTTALSIYKQ